MIVPRQRMVKNALMKAGPLFSKLGLERVIAPWLLVIKPSHPIGHQHLAL